MRESRIYKLSTITLVGLVAVMNLLFMATTTATQATTRAAVVPIAAAHHDWGDPRFQKTYS